MIRVGIDLAAIVENHRRVSHQFDAFVESCLTTPGVTERVGRVVRDFSVAYRRDCQTLIGMVAMLRAAVALLFVGGGVGWAIAIIAVGVLVFG